MQGGLIHNQAAVSPPRQQGEKSRMGSEVVSQAEVFEGREDSGNWLHIKSLRIIAEV